MMKRKANIKYGGTKLQSGIIYPEIFPIGLHDTVLNVGCGGGVQAITYKGNFKKMVGLDISMERLEVAKRLMDYYGIENFEAVNTNVERIPLEEKFDKAIAIDIIEHVIHPKVLVGEIFRLLKNDGDLLITFPTLHDKWEDFFKFVGRKILRRKSKTIIKEGWDPDQHQYDYKPKQWLKMIEKNGFSLVSSRASTMFPPLHYLGLPKFWFTNRLVHVIDTFFCKLPILKNYGQALVCVFKKKSV